MKKTFLLSDAANTTTRRVEAIKGDISKYIKRERRKKLPEGFDFWDFNCSFGDSVDEMKEIHSAEITKFIDDAASRNLEKFYIEILATARKRSKKAKIDDSESTNK